MWHFKPQVLAEQIRATEGGLHYPRPTELQFEAPFLPRSLLTDRQVETLQTKQKREKH